MNYQRAEETRSHRQKLKDYREFDLHDKKTYICQDISRPEDSIPLHSHSVYEIVFCCSGNVEYILNNQRYQLQRGDLVLIPPEIFHRPIMQNDTTIPYVRYVLWIDTAYYNFLCTQYADLDFAFQQCREKNCYLLRTTQATWTRFQSTFDSLYQETIKKNPCWELCVNAGALVLLSQINRTFYFQGITVPEKENDPLLEMILQYIDTHLEEKLTLDAIAHHCLVSKSKICNVFREQLGVSFYQCVIQRRLVAAKNSMLRGTALQQVCAESGFSDYSSFYRLFKKEFGVSPRQFLTIHNQMINEE